MYLPAGGLTPPFGLDEYIDRLYHDTPHVLQCVLGLGFHWDSS